TRSGWSKHLWNCHLISCHMARSLVSIGCWMPSVIVQVEKFTEKPPGPSFGKVDRSLIIDVEASTTKRLYCNSKFWWSSSMQTSYRILCSWWRLPLGCSASRLLCRQILTLLLNGNPSSL